MTLEPYIIKGGQSQAGASRLKHANLCSRLFVEAKRGRYIVGPAAHGGSTFHAGAAQLYGRLGATYPGGIQIDNRQFTDPAQLASPEVAVRKAAEELGTDAEHFIALVRAYEAHYRGDSFQPVLVEQELGIQIPAEPSRVRILRDYQHLVNPAGVVVDADERTVLIEFSWYLYTSRIDLGFTARPGRIAFLDYKTKGRVEKKAADYYAEDAQMSGMRYIGKITFGDAFDDVVLQLVQRDGAHVFARPTMKQTPARVAQFPDYVRDGEAVINMRCERATRMVLQNPGMNIWQPFPANGHENLCRTTYGPCSLRKHCDWGT